MNWDVLRKKIVKILHERVIIIIIAFSFLFSLTYSFFYKIAPVVDAQAYDAIAINLLDGFGFREDRTKDFVFDSAIVRAGPAYEFFLAGAYTIFGHHYEIVWVLQALLHAFTVYLIYLIGRSIFAENGETVGLLAAFFFAIFPDLIEISAMLMTETLYLFLITLAIWLFIKLYYEPRKILFSFLLALVTGLAILSRPPVILFIPIILLYFILNKKYKACAIFLAFLALTLVPWAIRNYLIYHQFILTTLIGEYNLWVGNTLSANGGQISSGFNPLTAYTDVHGFINLKQKTSQEFWLFISSHPWVFVKLCCIRCVRYFSLIRPMGFWFYQTGIKQIIFVASSGLSIALLFVYGFAGIIAACKEKKSVYNYLITFALTSPLVLIPTVVQSRYRFQIYPFLTIFGAYAVVSFFSKKTSVKRPLLIVSSMLALCSLIDVALFWPVIQARVNTLF